MGSWRTMTVQPNYEVEHYNINVEDTYEALSSIWRQDRRRRRSADAGWQRRRAVSRQRWRLPDYRPRRQLSWSRLSEQIIRFDKWNLCRG